jgi:hypothetical protein
LRPQLRDDKNLRRSSIPLNRSKVISALVFAARGWQ